MRRIKLPVLFLLILTILTACNDDEYVYPPVKTEFMDVATDETGTLSRLVSDQGETYRIQPRKGIDGFTPDSVYRTVSIYQIAEEDSQKAILYGTQPVISVQPVPREEFKQIKTDPVNIQSVWRAGNYINLIVLPAVKEKAHAFHFIDEGITEKNGTQTLDLRLYHDQNGDYEAFTREVYLSIPLNGYRNTLRPGSRIRLHIHTYKEGTVSRNFTY